MTCVIDDLRSMTYVVNDLWSMTCVDNDLCGRWPVWLMPYVVDDLCGCHQTLCTFGRVSRLIDYEKQESYFLYRFSSLVPTGLGGFSPIELLFFSKAISLIDVALPIAQPTMIWPAIVWPAKGATKRIKWGEKKEATRKRQQGRGDKEEVTRKNPSQYDSGARSRRVVGDLFPWRGERCREACMVVDYGSSTPEELHSTLFWPSLSSSKSLIIQVSYHPSPSLTKPRPSSFHQSRFFLPCP